MKKVLSKTESRALARTFFEVKTRLGFPVRTTTGYWKVITTVKHPSMIGMEDKVRECLLNPDEVRSSKRDKAVYLFYRKRGGRFLCVVVKKGLTGGFIVTTYVTDKIKEGDLIWKK